MNSGAGDRIARWQGLSLSKPSSFVKRINTPSPNKYVV